MIHYDKLVQDRIPAIIEATGKYDHDLFRKGEKPEALIDYPVHMTGFETVDLFNWQEQARDMMSPRYRVTIFSLTSAAILRSGSSVVFPWMNALFPYFL